MNSTKDLLDIVDEQKKTIEKYSNKLRDIVTAHKSLLVEKKALEDTIKILNETKTNVGDREKTLPDVDNKNNSETSSSDNGVQEEDLKKQVSSLLLNISNLIEEKAHMEENFKISCKQLLDDKKLVENKCRKLQDEVNVLSKQLKSNESRNPYDFFRKDSKKQSKDVKGTNKITSEQEGRFKISENDLSQQLKSYEQEVNNLKSELDAKRIIQEVSEKKLKEYGYELSNLQEELKNLQIEHQSELQREKQKARDVEERAKKLTAVQEERVVNLETRLAELSETIGNYDRLRLQDQNEIQKLKEHISHIDFETKPAISETHSLESKLDDYDTIAANIHTLKNQLETIAVRLGKEEDFKNLFPDVSNKNICHSLCKEEYNKMKAEFEHYKTKVKLNNDSQSKGGKEVEVLQNQVKNLQEKVKVLTDKNKNIEKEYQVQIEHLKKTMKNEKNRFKEALEVSGLDFRGRVWLLEEQLQKQRERSLAMLDEKEQEIQSLQSTFQMLLPGYTSNVGSEAEESSTLTGQIVDGPHIVHYTNEIARRDIEISSLRKKKHQIEIALRELQKEIVSITEMHKDEIKSLKNEIARLQRCQTREGANLEYLKNVVYSFLLSNDPKSKRHMCNAIAAVLKFSDSEIQRVIEHGKNKWWTSTSYT